MKTPQSTHKISGRILFFAVIVLVTIFVVATSFYAQSRLIKRSDGHFQDDVGRITKALVDDVESYNAVLYSARSFITSSQTVTQDEWDNFFRGQNTLSRYPGISAISFIEIVPKNTAARFESRMQSDPYFGPSFNIKDTNTPYENFAIASLISTDNNVRSAHGFDNYSTISRKAVYDLAAQTNEPVASRPIELATGPLGFFVTLPVYASSSEIEGFIAISFRAPDFAKTILGDNFDLLAGKISDVSDAGEPVVLYGSENWAQTTDQLVRTETIQFGGRKWEIQFKTGRSYNYPLLNRTMPHIIQLSGALLIALLFFIKHAYTQRRTANSTKTSR